MKKLFVFFALLVGLLGLASCSVAGNTYIYDSFEYEIAEDATKLESAAIEVAITAAKKVYENLEITFNEDGTTNTGAKWTKDGSIIKVDGVVDYEFKVSFNKLLVEVQEKNYSYTVTLVVKK